ncbi:MAG: hypothetical protein K6F01_01220 [Selenomonas sp.]|uniref:hypothetical protein n=1 Tax=Selenomonas sp. TaxID=2053611 RepID=UPI0025D757A7|nr:hypothetical protein [Selenomonas sp.]MCR5438069.1 hypothetical protein [Selenomonas sp.]
MRKEKNRQRCTRKESFFILSVAFLFLVAVAAVGVSQFPVGRELMVSQHVTAAASYDGPRIVGGVVPGETVRAEEKSGEDKGNDPIFLSWEFINGLFAIIIVLEFVIFPILFWMWFSPGSCELDENEEEDSEGESLPDKK